VFERARSVRLVLPGGHVRAGELSISGVETIDFLQSHHFDRYVLTASGLSIADGLTEWNGDDAGVKRAALRAASTITAAVDASKVGQTAFAAIAAIDAVDEVVTDAAIGADDASALREHVRLVVA
jgi:DeoR/GlpR family transcriptional regulator of sugar metabolism